MNNLDIARERLRNQHITHAPFKKPEDVVKWFGAIQAQDYLGALWAIGLRMRRPVEREIEQALADKKIIRTWPLRGTLNFVAPGDARWMLQLLTPRVIAANAKRMLRNYDLTDAVFSRCRDLFQKGLEGGKSLAREEMYAVLEAKGIPTANQRGLHILWRLAQEGVICFGTRRGKKQTFALLDEWIPPTQPKEREEALGEIATRYFTSHGPATLYDFVWWSGLATVDAKLGLELAKRLLTHTEIGDEVFWFSPAARPRGRVSQEAFLLPAFDEITVGYSDRTALFDAKRGRRIDQWNSLVLNPTIVIDDRIVGTWKRTVKKEQVVLKPNLFAPLTRAEKRALAAAIDRYAAFLQIPVVLAK